MCKDCWKNHGIPWSAIEHNVGSSLRSTVMRCGYENSYWPVLSQCGNQRGNLRHHLHVMLQSGSFMTQLKSQITAISYEESSDKELPERALNWIAVSNLVGVIGVYRVIYRQIIREQRSSTGLSTSSSPMPMTSPRVP